MSVRKSLDNLLFKAFYKLNYYFLRKNYYLPIPDKDDLIYQIQSEMIGIEMNDENSLHLLENVVKRYKKEFNLFPINRADSSYQYYLLNSNFMAVDGNLYYSLIRHLKPKRIIEIGSGNSTLLAAHAIMKNKEEDSKSSTQLICIEPYPRKFLKEGFPGLSQLIEKKVQDVGLEFFQKLEPNDILFIDSSHALRSGGDVWWEYCEILPRIASGVYVHIHDISLPKPYPRVYFDGQLFWNEQYILQAFLTYNSEYEVVWAGNYLMTKYPKKMIGVFNPEYGLMKHSFPRSSPTSFWIRRK